jgi:hypothetical protein
LAPLGPSVRAELVEAPFFFCGEVEKKGSPRQAQGERIGADGAAEVEPAARFL